MGYLRISSLSLLAAGLLYPTQPAGSMALPKFTMGKVVFLKGRADVIDLQSKQVRRAKIRETIYKRDEIRTGPDSKIEILIKNGIKVSVMERTVLNIHHARVDDVDKYTVRLLVGMVRVNVPEESLAKKQRLFLKTPVAFAQASAGDFGAITTLEETRVAVLSGLVRVGNRSKLMRTVYPLRNRYECKIEKRKEPIPPRLVPEEEIRDWFDDWYIDAYNNIRRKIREKDTFLDYLIKDRMD